MAYLSIKVVNGPVALPEHEGARTCLESIGLHDKQVNLRTNHPVRPLVLSLHVSLLINTAFKVCLYYKTTLSNRSISSWNGFHEALKRATILPSFILLLLPMPLNVAPALATGTHKPREEYTRARGPFAIEPDAVCLGFTRSIFPRHIAPALRMCKQANLNQGATRSLWRSVLWPTLGTLTGRTRTHFSIGGPGNSSQEPSAPFLSPPSRRELFHTALASGFDPPCGTDSAHRWQRRSLHLGSQPMTTSGSGCLVVLILWSIFVPVFLMQCFPPPIEAQGLYKLICAAAVWRSSTQWRTGCTGRAVLRDQESMMVPAASVPTLTEEVGFDHDRSRQVLGQQALVDVMRP
ncbi:hypothetical protein OG21DRAFT_1523077 [Imleria badia]|nr:hypothetical protein OG21DRAFT_1523077 [Imleria badia]